MVAVTTTFKPKQVTKRLLSALPERAREIISSRFSLAGADASKMTLEAIGKKYGITRERVRQIENYALAGIRKSGAFSQEQSAFDELAAAIESLGGIVLEDELLQTFSGDTASQNHIYFLLVLGDVFKKKKEDSEFKLHWYTDEELVSKVKDALKQLYKNMSDNDLVQESEFIDSFLNEIKDLNQKYKSEEIARRWLSISKELGKNPLGEWGAAKSPNVKVKGMRDYAYLAIKRHGSPMHFTEVAQSINDIFSKRAHVATTHNELIKDARFVLVGRGLYALSEWGYARGIVRDVIQEILRKGGPMTREEIIEQVRKERHIKDNTIIVNLQNPAYFKRNKDGTYSLFK
jgi:hypothetical protein